LDEEAKRATSLGDAVSIFEGATMRLALSAGIVLLAASAVGSAEAATTFYVGVQGGYLFSKSDVRIPGYPSEFNLDSHGAEGGIFAGIMVPVTTNWDVSFEGDFNLTNANNTHLSGGSGGELYKIDQKWNGSLRVLPGFWLTPTTQVFGEAGWRWASADASYVPPGPAGTKTADLSGYVLGIGLKEMIAPNWFIRGEYRYSHTDRATVVHGGPSNFDLRSNEALAGIGFTF
jgi:outer membrane immunogenic protein